MTVPTHVQQVVDDYLAMVDFELPGVIEGLYLVGSLALDDYRPKASDIDFVAVSAEPLDAASVQKLRTVHARLAKRHRRPDFDGPYVTWAQLAANPREAASGPHVLGKGKLQAASRNERHPVTWHTLAKQGITLRGPADFTIWTDPAALAESIHQNLARYWRPWHTKGSRLLSVRGLSTLINWGPAWAVLGVSRLHYTLATGEITSKDGAGEHAMQAFPDRWHKIINECLRIRRGQPGPSAYRSPFTRRREALAFLDMVIQTTQRPTT